MYSKLYKFHDIYYILLNHPQINLEIQDIYGTSCDYLLID